MTGIPRQSARGAMYGHSVPLFHNRSHSDNVLGSGVFGHHSVEDDAEVQTVSDALSICFYFV